MFVLLDCWATNCLHKTGSEWCGNASAAPSGYDGAAVKAGGKFGRGFIALNCHHCRLTPGQRSWGCWRPWSNECAQILLLLFTRWLLRCRMAFNLLIVSLRVVHTSTSVRVCMYIHTNTVFEIHIQAPKHACTHVCTRTLTHARLHAWLSCAGRLEGRPWQSPCPSSQRQMHGTRCHSHCIASRWVPAACHTRRRAAMCRSHGSPL